MKILAIGSSFTENSLEYVYGIAKDCGIDDVVLGNAYYAGCSLNQHWQNAASGSPAYTYQKNYTGVRIDQSGKSMLDCLKDENWDVIVLNMASQEPGIDAAYANLSNMVQYVKANKTNPAAKIAWHMTWAYNEECTHPGFASYNNSQLDMYNAIVAAVQKNVLGCEGIDFVIPAGTAIQNLRTSVIGDNLNAVDGYHLNQLGCYASGMTWFYKIRGYSIDEISYVPDKNIVSDEYLALIKTAAKTAVNSPYEITSMN